MRFSERVQTYNFPVLAIVVLVALSGCCSYTPREGESAVEESPPEMDIMEGAHPLTIDHGRSRACLLLHGFASSPADFGTLPGALGQAGWDVYVPRLPGHGTTPVDLAKTSACELLSFADKQYSRLEEQYETLVVGGFSMGGTIATGLACSHEPDALVLVSPFYKLTYKFYYVLPPEWWHALLSPFINYIPAAKAVNRPGGAEELTVYDVMPTAATRELFVLRDQVMNGMAHKAPGCPALLVYSENDDVASPRAMRRVFRKLPSDQKRKSSFTRSNHHILRDWDRQETVEAVLDFLGEL